MGIFNIPSSQTDTQRRTMDGAHRERSILLLPRLRVYSLSEGKGVCRCFAGEKPNERRRRRKRERGRNTVSCREAGRRKAYTRAYMHAPSQAVCSGGMRKAKQRVRRSDKNPLSVNKYSNLNKHAET